MGNYMLFWAGLFLCVGLVFSSLAVQLISTFLCLGVLSVELASVILLHNIGVLGHFSDILSPFSSVFQKM